MRHRNDSNMTQEEKEWAACKALADLFGRDAAEIVGDPRYAQPESAPLPTVGKLTRAAKQLRTRSDRQ